jgi:hypothetical protein
MRGLLIEDRRVLAHTVRSVRHRLGAPDRMRLALVLWLYFGLGNLFVFVFAWYGVTGRPVVSWLIGQHLKALAEISPLALLASWWLAGRAQRPFRTTHPLRIPLPREELARAELMPAESTPPDDRPGRTVRAHRQAVLFDAIVADILATVDTSATRVHISLQPTVIRAEPGSLAMLVRNLLTYAVRHNIPDGGVWVSLTTAGGLTTLTVEHTGPPLGADDLPALLARSYQSDPDIELAIVRTVVRAHRGTVAATARSGGGLLVRVTLPTR